VGFEEALGRLPPALQRFCRTRLTLPFAEILSLLPEQGTLLDVGCGIGMVTCEVGKQRPGLDILGIDLEADSIRLASRLHSRPNVRYACQDLGAVPGLYDCVSFVDVFHHVPDSEKGALLAQAERRLTPRGYVFVKDTTSGYEDPAYWFDRFIGGCPKLWFTCPEGLAKFRPHGLKVTRSFRGYRFPFEHYYLILSRCP
jgi:2-polyprenyl-3-methyl-5-hydroxy-6-metoxy-1,4-benzoquinol methylase